MTTRRPPRTTSLWRSPGKRRRPSRPNQGTRRGRRSAAAEIADFYGAETGDDDLPLYAHPAGEWDDFLNADDASAADTPAEPVSEAVSEPGGSIFDESGDGAADPDAGSIRELLDRVKTEVGGAEDGDPDDDADGENGGAAAAR